MGKILKIIFIIFLILIAMVILSGVIIYNFMYFEVATICISNQNKDTIISCSTDNECIEAVNNYSIGDISEIPEFMREKTNKIIEKSVYCEGTCRIKEIQIVNIIDKIDIPLIKKVEECDGEEIKLEYSPKEIVQILKQIKD